MSQGGYRRELRVVPGFGLFVCSCSALLLAFGSVGLRLHSAFLFVLVNLRFT